MLWFKTNRYFRLRLIAGINWTKRFMKFTRLKNLIWPQIWPQNISVLKHYNTNSGSRVPNGHWKITIITWTHFQVYFPTIKHFQHSLSSSHWYEIKDRVKLSPAPNLATHANEIFHALKNDSKIAFYTITMFIPIVVLTLLCPIGLILPVESGEKMGLQITLLLTLVVYIQILQETLPTFRGYHNSPVILNFFVVTIISCCVSILLSTWTLYLYHVESFEVWNYGRMEAKIRWFLRHFIGRTMSVGVKSI